MGTIQPINWTVEEKQVMVEEFLQEYRQTNCYTTTFARKRGLNESTFLGWVRRYDSGRVYPDGNRGRTRAHGEAGSLVLVAPQSGHGASQGSGLGIEFGGCSIHLGCGWTTDELCRVLSAIKEVGR